MNKTLHTQPKDTITKGIGWITIGSLVFISVFLNTGAYINALENEKDAQIQQLSTIAKSVASRIDGDDFEKVLALYQRKGTLIYNGQDQDFVELHDLLKTAQQRHRLKAPIYTLSKYENNNSLFYAISSENHPVFEHAYKSNPRELLRNYDYGGNIDGLKDERGKWFSAYEPILNREGDVVGAVLADNVVEKFGAEANEILLRNITISLTVLIVMALLLKHYLDRIINILRAKKKAEHTALIKAKFLSTMSHEIRTPMNAVIGLTNILSQENPRPDQVENLNTLKFSADLLLSLINDILDFSKIEAGKITLESLDFDLHMLIKNIRNSMRSKSEEKNLKFEIAVDPAIPEMVKGDQVRLSQILTNLTANAIKFTTVGKVMINLSLVSKTEENTIVRFSIKDTGIGIPEHKFEKIFQSFSQADTDTTRKFGGTGLGLSITKKLLELQGSEIKLESEVGKGSNFYFDLSFGHAIQKAPVKKEEAPFSNFDSFQGTKILLVEDNKINVLVAKKFLNKWNLNIDTAENGAMALKMVQKEDYKLVLMDLEMPVMDGYTATQKIRELKPMKYQHLPIIALSASAISDFRTKALKVGMNEFVTKPFNPGELHSVISRFIKEPA